MIQIFTLFLLGCVVSTLGERRKRIAYGTPVTESQRGQSYPFMVYINICVGILCRACTGTLVKRNRVLTAAHCFCLKTRGKPIIRMFPHSMYKENIGVFRKERRMTGFRLASKRPAFNCAKEQTLQAGFDVALIAIYKTMIRVTDGMKPVPLLCKRPSPGQSVTMIGYGDDERGEEGLLRSATGRTIPCPKKAAWRKQNLICMGLREKTPQIKHGDDGGPLLVKRKGKLFQIGIARGYENLGVEHHGFRSVMLWSSVAPYCKWIKSANTPARSDAQRSAVSMTGAMILSFFIVIVLNF